MMETSNYVPSPKWIFFVSESNFIYSWSFNFLPLPWPYRSPPFSVSQHFLAFLTISQRSSAFLNVFSPIIFIFKHSINITVFPAFLTGLRYQTVTHRDRDRDLTSVQRSEMINKNSVGIVTGRSRCGNGAQSKTLEILDLVIFEAKNLMRYIF